MMSLVAYYDDFCALIPRDRQPNVVLPDGFDARVEMTVADMPKTLLLAQVTQPDVDRVWLCGGDVLEATIYPENKLQGAQKIHAQFSGQPQTAIRYFTVTTIPERIMVERMARTGGIFITAVVRNWLSLDAARNKGRELAFSSFCDWAQHQLGQHMKAEHVPWELMRMYGLRYQVLPSYGAARHAHEEEFGAGMRDVWVWLSEACGDHGISVSMELIFRAMRELGLTPREGAS